VATDFALKVCELLSDLGQTVCETINLVFEALDGFSEWGRYLLADRAQIDEEANDYRQCGGYDRDESDEEFRAHLGRPPPASRERSWPW
jgi:hypothetical protein